MRKEKRQNHFSYFRNGKKPGDIGRWTRIQAHGTASRESDARKESIQTVRNRNTLIHHHANTHHHRRFRRIRMRFYPHPIALQNKQMRAMQSLPRRRWEVYQMQRNKRLNNQLKTNKEKANYGTNKTAKPYHRKLQNREH